MLRKKKELLQQSFVCVSFCWGGKKHDFSSTELSLKLWVNNIRASPTPHPAIWASICIYHIQHRVLNCFPASHIPINTPKKTHTLTHTRRLFRRETTQVQTPNPFAEYLKAIYFLVYKLGLSGAGGLALSKDKEMALLL
jgi:hypothetical protein